MYGAGAPKTNKGCRSYIFGMNLHFDGRRQRQFHFSGLTQQCPICFITIYIYSSIPDICNFLHSHILRPTNFVIACLWCTYKGNSSQYVLKCTNGNLFLYLILHLLPHLIIVTTATTGGGVPFSSRRTFFHREREMDCF